MNISNSAFEVVFSVLVLLLIFEVDGLVLDCVVLDCVVVLLVLVMCVVEVVVESVVVVPDAVVVSFVSSDPYYINIL